MFPAVQPRRRGAGIPPRSARLPVFVLALGWAAPCLAQTAPPLPGGPPPAEGALSLDLDIVAKQFDAVRSNIQPSLGATVYTFSRDTIETQPQGDNAPLNQLMLQAPGVAQDSFG